MWTLPQIVKIQNGTKCDTTRKSPSGSIIIGSIYDASPHHEVATDVKHMPIRPVIILSAHYSNFSLRVSFCAFLAGTVTSNFKACSSHLNLVELVILLYLVCLFFLLSLCCSFFLAIWSWGIFSVVFSGKCWLVPLMLLLMSTTQNYTENGFEEA